MVFDVQNGDSSLTGTNTTHNHILLQECLVQNGVLNRAVSEAAGKGVPGLAVEDGVDSQVSFLSKYQNIKISNQNSFLSKYQIIVVPCLPLPKRCQALSNVPHLTIQPS